MPGNSDSRGILAHRECGRLPYLFLALLWTGLFLAACNRPAGEPGRRSVSPPPQDALEVQTEGKFGGELRYALAGEPSTLNPLMARESRSKLLAYLTSATLLEFDPLKRIVTPGLAQSWTRSEDGREITLKLRRGIHFSDGQDFSAADVLFTFDKIFQQGSRNALRDSLTFKGKPLKVSAPDPQTVKIVFPEPFAAAPYILTTVPILPRHCFPDPQKKIEDYWNLDTPPGKITGLGPFALREHVPGERAVLAANPRYWKVDRKGRRLPYLDRLTLLYIPDGNARILRFEGGEIDLIDSLLQPDEFEYLSGRNQKKWELADLGASNNLFLLWYNLSTNEGRSSNRRPRDERRWFQNPRFRKATSLAIDREAIVRNVFLGKAHSAQALLPASPEVGAAPCCQQDTAEARRILKSAGFSWRGRRGRQRLVDPRGRPVQFEVATRSGHPFAEIVSLVQQDLESIGISVTIRQEELRSLISRLMGSREYDAAVMKINVPLEPADQFNLLLSSGTMHMWNPGQARPATPWEARIDELLLQQSETLDPLQRKKTYRQVEEILARQLPFIPLLHSDMLLAAKRGLTHLRPSTLFPFALWNAWEISWK